VARDPVLTTDGGPTGDGLDAHPGLPWHSFVNVQRNITTGCLADDERTLQIEECVVREKQQWQTKREVDIGGVLYAKELSMTSCRQAAEDGGGKWKEVFWAWKVSKAASNHRMKGIAEQVGPTAVKKEVGPVAQLG
jgi:hypothetical protein